MKEEKKRKKEKRAGAGTGAGLSLRHERKERRKEGPRIEGNNGMLSTLPKYHIIKKREITTQKDRKE